MKDISNLFSQTHSNLIRDILDKGGVVLGMKAKHHGGETKVSPMGSE